MDLTRWNGTVILRLARFPGETRTVTAGPVELEVDPGGRVATATWPEERCVRDAMRLHAEPGGEGRVVVWLTGGGRAAAATSEAIGAPEARVHLDAGGAVVGLEVPAELEVAEGPEAPAEPEAVEREPAPLVDAASQPGDHLVLRPDEHKPSGWLLVRGFDALARVQLHGMDPPVIDLGDGRRLLVEAVRRSTLALSDPASGGAEAWLRDSRRPWRREVVLPGDEDDLTLTAGPLRSPRLRGDGLIATFATARGDQVHVDVASSEHRSAVLLVAVVLLLEEIDRVPGESRAVSDAAWEGRGGVFDAVFGS